MSLGRVFCLATATHLHVHYNLQYTLTYVFASSSLDLVVNCKSKCHLFYPYRYGKYNIYIYRPITVPVFTLNDQYTYNNALPYEIFHRKSSTNE